MKEVSQETKDLTAIENEIFTLMKKQFSTKISLFYLSQEKQYIFYLPSKKVVFNNLCQHRIIHKIVS